MTMTRRKVLLVGKSGRLDCLAEALARSPKAEIYTISEVTNPGLTQRSAAPVQVGRTDDPDEVERYAREIKPDFAVIGPEEPLAAGVVDRLLSLGIPSVGPLQACAQLESSKAFTRKLIKEHRIPGNPEHRIFTNMHGVRQFLRAMPDFVVKPDGLTGGKGVKVSGEHLRSTDEAIAYCEEIFSVGQPAVIIEEKLEGEEFSFQSFFDGKNVVHSIPVQDHKRAHEGDTGPNTGGMGSYSSEDHLLPFLTQKDIEAAQEINRRVGEAVSAQTNQPYKGILYGGFILTRDGLRVIEFNARFGDPEVMNVLPILENDFVDVCESIINGTLHDLDVRFSRRATVCKYVVPEGYPTVSTRGAVDLQEVWPLLNDDLRMYYAAVDDRDGHLALTGSRALAFVGIGRNVAEAEQLAEKGASSVRGPVRHRSDIGTTELVQKRVQHMHDLQRTWTGDGRHVRRATA